MTYPEGFYVYALFDPRNPCEPFYIGKGFHNRAWDHLIPSGWSHTPLGHKLKSISDFGLQPQIEIQFENLTEEDSFRLEIKLIAKYGRRDLGTGYLLNLTDGGEGVSGHKKSKELREKISKRLMGNKYSTKIAKLNSKPIVAKLCGIIVEKYESLAHAEKAGYRKSTIRNCLKDRRYFAYGLEWSYI